MNVDCGRETRSTPATRGLCNGQERVRGGDESASAGGHACLADGLSSQGFGLQASVPLGHGQLLRGLVGGRGRKAVRGSGRSGEGEGVAERRLRFEGSGGRTKAIAPRVACSVRARDVGGGGTGGRTESAVDDPRERKRQQQVGSGERERDENRPLRTLPVLGLARVVRASSLPLGKHDSRRAVCGQTPWAGRSDCARDRALWQSRQPSDRHRAVQS